MVKCRARACPVVVVQRIKAFEFQTPHFSYNSYVRRFRDSTRVAWARFGPTETAIVLSPMLLLVPVWTADTFRNRSSAIRRQGIFRTHNPNRGGACDFLRNRCEFQCE
jgi:hypothetical protein